VESYTQSHWLVTVKNIDNFKLNISEQFILGVVFRYVVQVTKILVTSR
jgi:hypothetical protein